MSKEFEKLKTDVNGHISNNTGNPHKTKSSVMYDLSQVDNTSDANKPVSNALSEALSHKMDVSDIYDSLEDSETIDLSTKPLSARIGVVLSETIDGLINTGETYNNISQRIEKVENILL